MAPASTAPPRRVVVSGSSGLIGTALVASLRADGIDVTTLVRRSPGSGEAQWDPAAGTIDRTALEGADAVVHLAGVGIADRKWTDDHRRAVLDSRTSGTTLIARTIAGLDRPPAVFASASAIGFYGDRGDEQLDETSSSGEGFLADVVGQWEASTALAADATRVSHLRTGLVLSTCGGALRPQLLPFKLGLGGRMGNGKQWLSWITLDDEVRAIRYVLDTDSISGAVNLVGPNPVTNSTFTKALGKALKRPTLIPIPLAPLRLRFGADMVREMLLSSTRVTPAVLTRSGFTFSEPDLAGALRHLLVSRS